MPETYSSPRLLMNRLRHMMAGDRDASQRLDKVVKLVAGTMIADVCSIYLRTSDDALELIATEGLRADAVARTRLNMDEGLVGHIARSAQPLAIQDAPRHPAFSYRPETGEDPYHAFLGVPILRGGRVSGVLTVQNRTERLYDEDEIETLQTIAMVLAEVLAGMDSENGLIAAAARAGPATMRGRSLCAGIGTGRAVFHDPVVPAARFFSADPGEERKRLDDGLRQLRISVDTMMAIDTGALMGEPRDVLETYRLLAHDPAWAERLQEGVASGLTAEAAIDRARQGHRARLAKATDPYLRERLHDLEDLDNRLLRILGGNGERVQMGFDEPTVLVARRLGPADLLEYAEAGLAAILIEDASVSSHAAIVARALGIPTLGNLPGLTTAVEAGDCMIVDADEGVVHLRADDGLESSYASRIALRSERMKGFAALRDQPAISRDGTRVHLMINAGLELDLQALEETGAEGIGLFRTEFQFLVSETLPRLGQQIQLYKHILDVAGERPVWFRTVDLGGDKMLPSLNRQREENPALGWRSLRFALDTPGLFRRQLRALVRAAGKRDLHVMFPMVTIPEEFFEAKALLLHELDWSRERGHAVPETIRIGAMLEVPSFAYCLEEMHSEIDFISVGTNDLMQFFFAADRMTPQVADRYRPLSHAFLRFLREVSDKCRSYGIPVSVCGEASSEPVRAVCLAALGFHRLSMAASGVGPVKQAIRAVHLGEVREALDRMLDQGGPDLRKEILGMLEHNGTIAAAN